MNFTLFSHRVFPDPSALTHTFCFFFPSFFGCRDTFAPLSLWAECCSPRRSEPQTLRGSRHAGRLKCQSAASALARRGCDRLLPAWALGFLAGGPRTQDAPFSPFPHPSTLAKPAGVCCRRVSQGCDNANFSARQEIVQK